MNMPPCPKHYPRVASPVVPRKCGLGACLALLAIVALVGCSRDYYRREADREVADLLNCAGEFAGSDTREYGVYADPRSRYFDPYNPDRPPMPPDDPAAHQLMHCVDCKKGWPFWHTRYGLTPFTENPYWEQYLPRSDRGDVVLDTCAAFQLALLHSRDYQDQVEDLYVSALDVTLERFAFDAQFFGGNSTFYTSEGRLRSGTGQSRSILETNTDLEVRKLCTTGGTLVAGVANSLVWQFSGPDQYSANTVLDFTLIQPLLRGAGRAVVMENLTQSERALLANVRQFDRWRRGFYLQVAIGRTPGPGPVIGGIALESLDPGGLGTVGGVLGLLEAQQQILNQETNIGALRSSVELLQIALDNNQLDSPYQVNLARQRLLQAERSLLTQQTNYERRLDQFKLTLGLPPGLELRIADPQLDRFHLIDPELTRTEHQLADVLDRLRNPADYREGAAMASVLPDLAELAETTAGQLQDVAGDIEELDRALPQRKRNLQELTQLPEFDDAEIEPSVVDVADLESRVDGVHELFDELQEKLRRTVGQLQELAARQLAAGQGDAKDDPFRKEVLEAANELSSLHLQLQLVQARARLDAITLVQVDMPPERALAIARENRRDWQNARSALVDSWRQIEIFANDLKSDLDVVFSGDLGTTDNNPIQFRSSNGRLRVGLEFDAPLTRLAERNNYRVSLINFQRAKRIYYGYEDNVSRVLRDTLRQLRLIRLIFEVQRAALRLAVVQVDVKREDLARPARPDEQLSLSPTAARDLIGALSDLLDSQNDLISLWVNYEALRMSLDYDLGTMQLDRCGMWVDPGAIGGESESPTPAEAPEAPMPDWEDVPEIIPAPDPVLFPQPLP